MPEVKHFDDPFGFVKVIVDQDRAVNELSYPRTFPDDPAHTGKAIKQVHVVEQGVAEAGSGLVVILGNVADDAGEIG